MKITLAYDGTAYNGWQVQATEPTIQSTIEKALLQITGQSVRVTASGRTDAGVHALGQVLGVRLETSLDNHALCRALNATTPFDIEFINVETAADGFHAIRDAKRKRYRYVIQHGTVRDVIDRAYSWFLYGRLNVPAMKQAAEQLVGTHDFASFQAAGSDRKTTVRTIYELCLTQFNERGADKISIEVEADGFLYNMVRNIVGTLVDIGRGKQDVDWIGQVLAAQDRCAAGVTAPPQGLFLLKVDY